MGRAGRGGHGSGPRQCNILSGNKVTAPRSSPKKMNPHALAQDILVQGVKVISF